MSKSHTEGHPDLQGQHQHREREHDVEAEPHPNPRLSPAPLSPLRLEIVVGVGEFLGTFMFLFMGMSAVEIANVIVKDDADVPSVAFQIVKILYIASAFGLALGVNAWVFYRVSGSCFNPALALGFLVLGLITPLRAIYIMFVQLFAGICAAAMVNWLTPGKLSVSNTLGNGTTPIQGLFIEVFLTSQLMLAVLFLAVEKHKATFVAPLGIGGALFVIHLAGIPFSGASVNPARSLGPAVIEGVPNYHWIYWVGPFLGSALGALVYRLLRWLEYRLANPTQDFDDAEMFAYELRSREPHILHRSRVD